MVSVCLYCAGLLVLMLANNPFLLPVAIVIFIAGEVLMTPCFDETAKKHSSNQGMGTCMGLLHLVDGSGRMIGSAFALAVYGAMRNSAYKIYYWPVVVAVFFCVCSVLHIIAFRLTREEPAIISSPGAVAKEAAVSLEGRAEM
jgi:hypothetical protein